MSNRLKTEGSPYLQMHGENPVDWYPWGDEAFAAAREQDKPMLISIGYSACHWCHVIASESFSDPDLAAVANRFFISVKVDREEHPAVDAVYMNACQLITGRGGWPLNVFATPEGKPFFAFTYLPKDRLTELLAYMAMSWHQDRSGCVRAAETVTEQLEKYSHATYPARPRAKMWDNCYQRLAAGYDREWGGFGPAPKFPTPQNLLFLLEYHRYTGDPAALEMAEHTLQQMYRGGIFDHIGGGFCRYSTDEKWLVPHFEKMLYDNALMLYVCAEAYGRTGSALYRTMGERTADYVLRELRSPGGGFFASQNADSEGVEGKYYLFTPEEVRSVLGDNDGAVFCRTYGITEEGNFEGGSIPSLLDAPDFADDTDLLREMRMKLYRRRLERSRLDRDEKVLSGWNGLMIAALARAGRVFGREKYLDAAVAGEAFLREQLTHRGGLLRRWRDGEARFEATLDDYAACAWALTELADAGCGEEYLLAARTLADRAETLFADTVHGGYYLCSDADVHLPVRPKEVWDGACPSGNAMLLFVLLRLLEQGGDRDLRRRALAQMAFMAGAAGSYDCPFALTAMMRFAGEYAEQSARQ